MYPYYGGARGYQNPTQASEESLKYGLMLGQLIGGGVNNLVNLFPGSPANQQANKEIEYATGQPGTGGQNQLQSMMKAAMIRKALSQGQMTPYEQARLQLQQSGQESTNQRFQESQQGLNARFQQSQAGIEDRFKRGQEATQGRYNATQEGKIKPEGVAASWRSYLRTLPGYNPEWDNLTDKTGKNITVDPNSWKSDDGGKTYYIPGQMLNSKNISLTVPGPIFQQFAQTMNKAQRGVTFGKAPPQKLTPNQMTFGVPSMSTSLPSDRAVYGNSGWQEPAYDENEEE